MALYDIGTNGCQIDVAGDPTGFNTPVVTVVGGALTWAEGGAAASTCVFDIWASGNTSELVEANDRKYYKLDTDKRANTDPLTDITGAWLGPFDTCEEATAAFRLEDHGVPSGPITSLDATVHVGPRDTLGNTFTFSDQFVQGEIVVFLFETAYGGQLGKTTWFPSPNDVVEFDCSTYTAGNPSSMTVRINGVAYNNKATIPNQAPARSVSDLPDQRLVGCSVAGSVDPYGDEVAMFAEVQYA